MTDTWADQAACKDHPTPDIFFSADFIDLAQQFCRTCPVRFECRQAGADEPFGMWGGYYRERGSRDLTHGNRKAVA